MPTHWSVKSQVLPAKLGHGAATAIPIGNDELKRMSARTILFMPDYLPSNVIGSSIHPHPSCEDEVIHFGSQDACAAQHECDSALRPLWVESGHHRVSAIGQKRTLRRGYWITS